MGLLFRILISLVLLIGAVTSARAFSITVFEGENPPSNLHWKNRVIRIAISVSFSRGGTNIRHDSDVVGALRRSLQVWELASDVKFVVVHTDRENVSPPGTAGDGVSLITIAPTAENVLLFLKDPENVAATTRIFYNSRGFITEADIALNPYQQFSTDGTFGTFDLESTLTHEIGHLLGLEHSSLRASTMHENFGRNGIYFLQNFTSRTLSAADHAAVRALYGAPSERNDCCGTVTGRLMLNGGRPLRDVDVWLENSKTGVVFGRAATQSDGSFRIGGLPFGGYRVFSEKRGSRTSYGRLIAEVVVDKPEATIGTKVIVPAASSAEVLHVGFNGQLSELPVLLNAGRSYTLYLGGLNLDPRKITVGFNTPFLTVLPDSFKAHDYGPEISVISFEVRVDPRTPLGDYTVFIESNRGARSFLPGALTVDTFLNPYSNGISSTE